MYIVQKKIVVRLTPSYEAIISLALANTALQDVFLRIRLCLFITPTQKHGIAILSYCFNIAEISLITINSIRNVAWTRSHSFT